MSDEGLRWARIAVGVNELIRLAHGMAKEKGWWDGSDHNIPEKLCLIHSEVSEALEAYRIGGDLQDWEGVKPDGFAIELADAVIRIADLCGHLGIDLGRAITEKVGYNATRPYRHGGKKA